MTAKDVYEAVTTVDGQDIGKGTNIVLEALVKDGEEIRKRIDSIEDKVNSIDRNVCDMKEAVEKLLDRKQSGWLFLSELIKETRFWLWIIILTVLAYGVSITDLKGLIGG
jgi:hypothetical protein